MTADFIQRFKNNSLTLSLRDFYELWNLVRYTNVKMNLHLKKQKSVVKNYMKLLTKRKCDKIWILYFYTNSRRKLIKPLIRSHILVLFCDSSYSSNEKSVPWKNYIKLIYYLYVIPFFTHLWYTNVFFIMLSSYI